MSNAKTICVSAKLENLSDIIKFVTDFAEAAGLGESDVYAVQLATDEAFANIVNHAYEEDSCEDIECTCSLDEKSLIVVFRDYGQPFDPASIAEPNLGARLEDQDVNGLGLYFMRKMMDEVHFDFSPDSGNVLTMVKRRGAKA
jgi:serine/threonine-protein kinase RsbW